MESQDRGSCAVGHGCNAAPIPSASSSGASHSAESGSPNTRGEAFPPAVHSRHSLSALVLAFVELSTRMLGVRGLDLRKRSRRGRESPHRKIIRTHTVPINIQRADL